MGGDDLDGGTDELPMATMGAILPVLRCDLSGAIGGTISAALRRRDLGSASGGAISSVLGCEEIGAI